MGKAQSKRSVDITTEAKKGTDDEITEKMEKIEDLDKKEVVNGDATISERNDAEKKDTEEVENDKDMTTEKDVDVQASGEAAEPQNNGEPSKDDVCSANAEEISPLADENIKKSKKEKVKKKWSFRSISFGKKDKQKPTKNEDQAEDCSAATNGANNEEKTAIVKEPEDTQKGKCMNEKEEKTPENCENGVATPQELNGVELNEKNNSNVIAANMTNNTFATETCASVQKETAAVSCELSEKTDNTAVTNEPKVIESSTIEDDASKNGIGENMNPQEQETQNTSVTDAFVEFPSEKTIISVSAVTNTSSAPTNGEMVGQVHQNGDHGESAHEVENSKAQIEVNFKTDKVSAAILNYISTTSINPSNAQVHVQDLNVSSEKPDEIFQIGKDESVVQKSFTGVSGFTVDQSSFGEIVNILDAENKKQIEAKVSDVTLETVDSDKSFEENHDIDLPPPLPISPPPSQVSMFAFTNNDSVEEGSTQTKNFEPVFKNLKAQNEKGISLLCEPPVTETPSSEETYTIRGEYIIKKKTYHESVVPQCRGVESNKTINGERENNEGEEENNCAVLNKDNDLPSDFPKESLTEKKEPSVDFAAAVINEITKVAAEIVNQQLKCEENPITDGQSLQNIEKRKEEESINEYIIVECVNKNQNEGCNVDNQKFNSAEEESPIIHEQTNNSYTEYSVDITPSASIQQDQDMMISLRKNDHLDEEYLNPIKEFPTARDFKDNVVSEIAQDISVTCE